MKISRLASALTLSLLAVTSVEAAKYRVVELPLGDKGVNSFSVAINERGDIAASIETPFDPPIDIDILNFQSETLIALLEDPASASIGNINDDDLAVLFNFITASANQPSEFFPQSPETVNPFLQQIADVQSYVSSRFEVEPVIGFDVIDADLGSLTKSADTQVRGINRASVVVGTAEAPYYKVNFRDQNGNNLSYQVNDYIVRGFIEINGQSFDVMPDEDFAGGISAATDINDSFEVTGFGSVEITEGFETLIENCADPDLRFDEPKEYCVRRQFELYKQNALTRQSSGRLPIDTLFDRKAMIWQFNSQGDLLSSRELGTLIPEEFANLTFYSSKANAINNNGIAVGVSNAVFQDVAGAIVNNAAIFDGDEVISFTEQQTYRQSEAFDISDNDIVVGHMFKQVGLSLRSKFFVHDYREGFTTFPDDFFESSSSTARAINNNDLVVGDGEIDTNLSGTRRREAFIYDIDSGDFDNINDLLSCDSPYTIVQGNDINDSDEIAATAIIYREQSSVTGELALDDKGNPIFGNVSVSVKLEPIPGGSIDDCRLVTETLERKGGSAFYLLPLLFAGLVRKRK